jgi:uncharacterized protein YjbJ (UPF0337 family)
MGISPGHFEVSKKIPGDVIITIPGQVLPPRIICWEEPAHRKPGGTRMVPNVPLIGNKILTLPLSRSPNNSENTEMDKDRIEGSAKQTKGAVKEAAGKVVGDKKLETDGKADKAAGKVQNARARCSGFKPRGMLFRVQAKRNVVCLKIRTVQSSLPRRHCTINRLPPNVIRLANHCTIPRAIQLMNRHSQ